MDRKMSCNSSKDLLYSEITGTSVSEHVLERLEKKSIKSLQEKVVKTGKKDKSESFERAKKVLSMIEKEQDNSNASTENLNEKSNACADVENKKGIEVVMHVDENSPESNVNAWFFINLLKEQESKCSEDKVVRNSSVILNSSYSSGTSDDESEENFSVIPNQFSLNDSIFSTNSTHKKDLKHSKKITSNTLNFLNDDSSDTSNDESEQNFPVISNGFMLNNTDSSNCSSVENESNLSDSFKLQKSSNFDNDDSSNSKNGSYPSVSKSSALKENSSCGNSDALQLSISLKKDKRKFEIVNNKSSEYLNCESVKHYSLSSNPKRVSAEKKTMFIVNGSSDHSLDESGYNSSLHNGQDKIFEDNCSDSSSNMGDIVSGKAKINAALENEQSKFVSHETDAVSLSDLKKRKLCVVNDEISNNCDAGNTKKICVLDRRV